MKEKYRKSLAIATTAAMLSFHSCTPANDNIFKSGQQKCAMSVQRAIRLEQQINQKIEVFSSKFYVEFPELEKHKRLIEVIFIDPKELERN